MSIKNLFKRAATRGWCPDFDRENAPDGALLRADNAVMDIDGNISVRQGSETLYSGLVGISQTTGVHSLYAAYIPNPDPDGSLFYVAASGERVYVYNTSEQVGSVELSTASTEEHVAFADDSYQVFWARGTSKYKWDGAHLYNWPIAAPTAAATVAAGSVSSLTVMNFNNSTDTAIPSPRTATITVHEGSSTAAVGHDGVANSCRELTPDPGTGRMSISKVFDDDLDCFYILGKEGGDTDLIDFYVWLEEPRKVDKVTIMFGITSSATDPFKDDYYYFDFELRNPLPVDLKEQGPYGALAYTLAAQKTQSILDPAEITDLRSPADVQDVLARKAGYIGSTATARPDTQQSSPAWTHFTVMRGQFKRVGNTSGRNWETVRGVKFVYTATPGSTEKLRLDDMIVIGGGDRVLNGTYQVVYRFVNNTGNYKELSPASPRSDPIVLNQQPLTITLPSAAMSAADDQVNQVWVYLYGGFLDNFYRVAVLSSTASTGTWSMDEFDPSSDGTVDVADMRRGMVLELGVGSTHFSATSAVVLTVRKTELEILMDNEALEPGAAPIPDNIIAIAGPWLSRFFLVTDEGWVWPTSQTSPSNCNVYHAMDLRRYGDPMWAVKTGNGVYVGLTKDVVRIEGTGDESEDHLTANLYAVPLNVGNPPADRGVYTDGNSVIYRSADGLVGISGSVASPIQPGPTSALWRGYTRHGVSPLNIATGRFRMASDNQVLYMLAPEGSSTDPSTIWRADGLNKTWSRLTYSFTPLSIFRIDETGVLIVGTRDGKIIQIETGTSDDAVAIPLSIVYPWQNDGNSLVRKVPLDLQLHCDTGGVTGTITVDTLTDTAAYSFSGISTNDLFRINLGDDLDEFVKAKITIAGNFQTFLLRYLNMTYRPLPQHTMAVDAYVIPQGNSDVIWMQEVELDAITPSNLTLEVYLADELFYTATVTATANKRQVYRVPLPRDTKGYRPRLRVYTTAANNRGHVGFELYGMRVRSRNTGNMVEVPFLPVAPGGNE